MASVKTSAFRTRAFAAAVVVIVCAATRGPASAQYWGDRPSGGWGDRRSGGWGWDNRLSDAWRDRYRSDRYYRRSPNRDFLSPFSGERRTRPAPAADYSKAPPPRKLEKPATNTFARQSRAGGRRRGAAKFRANRAATPSCVAVAPDTPEKLGTAAKGDAADPSARPEPWTASRRRCSVRADSQRAGRTSR